MTMRGYVGIVDAYSSGVLYAPELQRRGYESVHIQSTDPIPPDDLPSFRPGDHAANLVFDGDLEKLVCALAAYAPACVIAGCEQAVQLADQLSERLGVKTNGTALSSARRDKFAMQRAVAAAGLASIPSHLVASWAEIAGWVAGNLPVVVKPPSSGGTDHVFICKTLADARVAFDSIVGHANTFGEMNHHAIVQPLIEGIEYNINHVSCDGHHYCTDIWRVDKVWGEHPVYDRGVVLPRRGEHQDLMVPYVTGVLDAIGIKYGPSHCEVMLTSSGPVLLEVAARLHGQSVQTLVEVGSGVNQAKVTLDAYLDPDKFFARMGTPYELQKQLQRIELICPRPGTLRGFGRLDDVRALPSFHTMKLYIEPGQQVTETVDLMTLPGFLDLVHPDPAVVERDHDLLRAWEADDFYDIVS